MKLTELEYHLLTESQRSASTLLIRMKGRKLKPAEVET
jgi:hypothetical protein